MEKIVNLIKNIFPALPDWIGAVILLILLGIIALFIAGAVSAGRFRKKIREYIEKHTRKDLLFQHMSERHWLRRSSIVENIASRGYKDLPTDLGLTDIWIKKLSRNNRLKYVKRVLKFDPDKGLFTVFRAALKNSRNARELMKWLEKSGDMLVLRRLALSGKGEDFNGQDAMNLFKDQIFMIREMTGDPEWATRYFSIKILLHDFQVEKSVRAVWESFKDPHPIVRKTIAQEFATNENDKLYDELYQMLLNDPVEEVRNAAFSRLIKDFKDRFSLIIKGLSYGEKLHALEFLRKDVKEDEDFAIKTLDGKDLELRFKAAMFLQKNGILNRFFVTADIGDSENFERTFRLLQKACEVDVTDFLKETESVHNPSSLIMAAKLLETSGEKEILGILAEKIFKQADGSKEMMEAYELVVRAVSERGSDEALRKIQKELDRQRKNPVYLRLLLKSLPERGESIFLPTLFSCLKSSEFCEPEELRATIIRFPKAKVLPVILGILKEGRAKYSHFSRIQALKILGSYKENYCVRFLLENLPVLPLEQAADFARYLNEQSGDIFSSHVDELIKGVDSKVRAALISSLPATEKKEFLTYIKEGINDADPDVRIASILSLVDFKETKSLPQTFDLLRDPVERVRYAAARTIGMYGGTAGLEQLRNILKDENEVDSVIRAAVEGLGLSDKNESISILVEKLEQNDEFRDPVINALSIKTTPGQVKKIIEQFKNGDPSLRDNLTMVFKKMGVKGEEAMMELLKEDIPSLRIFITEILESTGFVESSIRKLTHRDPATRRETARILSLIGTKSAFRGIVLAARDPDEEVRVQVVKALEKLNTKDGKTILEDLQSDPDKRIRKYTLWALERVKSKNL